MSIRKSKILSAALGNPDAVSVGWSFFFLTGVGSEALCCVFHRWWRDDAAFASVQSPPCRSADAAGRLIGAAFGLWGRATALPLAADATSLRVCPRLYARIRIQPSHPMVRRLLCVTRWRPSWCGRVRDVQTGGRFRTGYVEQSQGKS